ncbi:hypothetical protein [Nocardiopsis ansamitocini]|uniref:hypothetical protein n=1 Tax=Nocardiopsis ansamitocini TaxID=1670832 RepID=UPI00255645D9|nr:hypothetical protein [Nocardiopsis ansamitocini]
MHDRHHGNSRYHSGEPDQPFARGQYPCPRSRREVDTAMAGEPALFRRFEAAKDGDLAWERRMPGALVGQDGRGRRE